MNDYKIVWDIINKEEPRGQSITLNGIPCTARTCLTYLTHLTEENESIKNTIKEAYNNERTQIGKNVLKQLMEAIQ